VEAIGVDWAVTRNPNNEVEMVSGRDLAIAIEEADSRAYCHEFCEMTA
jgi:hypothetical protein